MRAVIEVDNINIHSGDRICRSADVHLKLLFQIHTSLLQNLVSDDTRLGLTVSIDHL
jgi:hypothetical protein